LGLQVALGDAAIVTGLHLGAKLPLSVSFAVAVAANLVLVLLLVLMLLVARVLNANNNSRLAAAANSREVRPGSRSQQKSACRAAYRL
jgi:membrane protein implicated in regulation of membrane protease activity